MRIGIEGTHKELTHWDAGAHGHGHAHVQVHAHVHVHVHAHAHTQGSVDMGPQSRLTHPCISK